MKYTFATRRMGAAKWALLMASIGFTYGLITSVSPSASANTTDVSSRALATNCTRLPTEFVTASDLGAVVLGTNFTRQILVRFGFRPHTFTFGQFSTTGGVLTSTASGKVQGNVASAGGNTFMVNVADPSVGVPQPPITGQFNITGVTQHFSEQPLHFETGAQVANGTSAQTIALPTAVAGDVYFYSLCANGGTPPYTFTVIAPGNKRFLPQGLAFDAKNALIYGKPLLPTPVGTPANITILLNDGIGSQVTGNFTLNVLPGTISSQAIATSGSMQLNYGNDNLFDSLSLTMILDKSDLNAAGIRSASDLKDLPISMNFGGFKLPPDAQPKSTTKIISTFDSKGTISVPVKHLVLGDKVGSGVKDVLYTIKLNPTTGILTARFKNINMLKTIGANFNSFEGQDDPIFRGPVIPINIRIGLTTTANLSTSANNTFDKTDVIKFVYKRTGSVGQGTARLNDNIAPAGIFLIKKVSGTEAQVVVDANNTVKEDRLFLQMNGLMRQPGAAPIVPATGDSVSVFINRLCLGMFPASSFAVNGDQLVFSNDDPTKGLKTLIIDNKKGTVLITTHGLAASKDLFGVDILVAGDPMTVPITLTIGGPNLRTPTFDGQSTVTIFRKGKNIVNR